jgi:hypothetical protein
MARDIVHMGKGTSVTRLCVIFSDPAQEMGNKTTHKSYTIMYTKPQKLHYYVH